MVHSAPDSRSSFRFGPVTCGALSVAVAAGLAFKAPLPSDVQPALAEALTPTATSSSDWIRPIQGSLVLAGDGDVPDCVIDAFLYLCDSAGARVAVISADGKATSVERWIERGALSAKAVNVTRLSDRALTRELLEANAVWIESSSAKLCKNEWLGTLLRNVLARDGVVGGSGTGALAIGGPGMVLNERASAPGFGLLPRSGVQLIEGSAGSASGDPTKIVDPGDGMVGWQIPESTALFVHHGRQITAFGTDHVVMRVPANGDWPDRVWMTQARPEFKPSEGDRIDYEDDLLAWLRSARDRQMPLFPPAKTPAAGIESGTLVLSGGGGVDDETFERFIAAAGGKNAVLICIPSADNSEEGRAPSSFSARRLRALGCENVHIIYSSDPLQAQENNVLFKPLETAGGVWVDGGRTYRLVDALQGTRAHQLMRDVLARGGAVGGSSAGCQIAGDFLLRGDPSSNQRLVFDGYTTGLAFLQGVIIDAHFRQRERTEALVALVGEHPQMLGIGVDAGTAIVVVGKNAEVVGSDAVTFIDASGAESKSYVLESGATFDLEGRAPR